MLPFVTCDNFNNKRLIIILHYLNKPNKIAQLPVNREKIKINQQHIS